MVLSKIDDLVTIYSLNEESIHIITSVISSKLMLLT